MKQVKYRLEKSGDFVIENYNKAKAFSSFFPGIAGLNGIPLWAFYVNRGQCITSFGVKNKDGAILEFFPANQAYNLTAIKGFRTFLRFKKRGRFVFYEPFKEMGGRDIREKMIINPYKLEIEEANHFLGIKINVKYITIPNEPFAGIARMISIANISKNRIDVELIDGLPHIVPFGMTEWHQKHMSRTIEAWMRVSNLEKKAPFYGLKTDPKDRPEFEAVEGGNFYAACQIGRNSARPLETIVDPDIVFGKDSDISYPRLFFDGKHRFSLKNQRSEGKMPSAFGYAKFTLEADQDKKIISIAGYAKDINSVNAISRKIEDNPNYFGQKLFKNKEIISRLQNTVFTKSSSDEFDFYTRQTFLDNLLRGGFPVSIETAKGPFLFYAYARKHGDLERDYNAFSLEPSYYSQGNGAYRDINQNRRNDVLFNPDVKDENILTFINAIQADGFNPHLIEGISLSVENAGSLDVLLNRHIKSARNRKKIKTSLLKKFTPGSFLLFLDREKIAARKNGLLKDVLAIGVKKDVVRPGEGYWVDHWTYNTDLLENYLACYPEKLKDLLLDKRKFTFYDTYLSVRPRSEKYVCVDGDIRQFDAVTEDPEKRRMIEERSYEPHRVRVRHGSGKVYKTDLLVKLLCVITNKMASLDPFGIGIEMEAGKPGWCDGLNGLPGIFGSSVCEIFEIKRLMLFMKEALIRLGIGDDYKIDLPSELADFLADLGHLVTKHLSSKSKNRDFAYWDASSGRKELYRDKVWRGFSGKEEPVSIGRIKMVLEKFLLKIESGIKKGFSKKDGMTYSYYINEVKKFRFIHEGGERKVNRDNLPLVEALAFTHRPVSLFLEGPVHAMKVMDQKKARSLYKAIRKSRLFDRKLKMYKLNESLKREPLEIGRAAIFTPGWLENESIWLHMEYKYLLELLRTGLYEEFFLDFKNCLVAFQDPPRYGRSILENSSFIVSSSYPDGERHGNGLVARLTGTTTEFLSMWLLMCLGKNPFKMKKAGMLCFEPRPSIPGWLFTREKSVIDFYFADGRRQEIHLPKDVFAFSLLSKTLVVLHNPKRRNTFGKDAVQPNVITLRKKGGLEVKFEGGVIPLPFALKIRDGFYDRIDIALS